MGGVEMLNLESPAPPSPENSSTRANSSPTGTHAIRMPQIPYQLADEDDEQQSTLDNAIEEDEMPVMLEDEDGTMAVPISDDEAELSDAEVEANERIPQVGREIDDHSTPRYHMSMPSQVSSVRVICRALHSQFYISFATIVLSGVLGTCAVVFRHEITDATQINSGLLLGSIGTLVMCSVIIISHFTTKWYRRHTHILLRNLALCEFFLALSFVLEPVWNLLGAGIGPDLDCGWLSTVREYLIMLSTSWNVCMAMDLYHLMTDPFTSPRLNRKKYQLFTHSMALSSAITMGSSYGFGAPVAIGDFCWIGAKRLDPDGVSTNTTGIWVFIITPIALSVSTNLYVTFISYRRFRTGIVATLKNRRALLREGYLTTITIITYSLVLWGIYAGYWIANDDTQIDILAHLFTFLFSYRGVVVFLLWCLYKRPNGRTSKTKPLVTAIPTTRKDDIIPEDNNSEPEEDDDAVRPQMNVALLEELVYYTTQGISKAVRMAVTLDSPATHTFTLRRSSPPPGYNSSIHESQFTDYHPHSFLQMRQFYGIDDTSYLTSLASCTTPKVSEGASGSFMFYSKDRSYIVKSLSSHESTFLHSFLDAYVLYMATHRDSFLTRFLGSYCLVLYGKKAHFVVMENVFDIQQGVSIHQRYDIKGSWVDRNAQKAKAGSEATCRHCNLTFRCGVGRDVCPNRAGSHEPNVVLKDMDLTTKLRFGKAEGRKLIYQLKSDSDFLCDQGVMDYSLLLGVIEVSYQVNQQKILTRDGNVFMAPNSNEHSTNNGGIVHTPAVNPRVKQSTQGMRTSEVVIGPGFYYIGLIDILQTWNWSKRFERFTKTFIFRKDPDGISAMPPNAYRARFHKKLDEIVHLGNNVLPPSPKAAARAMTAAASTPFRRAGAKKPRRRASMVKASDAVSAAMASASAAVRAMNRKGSGGSASSKETPTSDHMTRQSNALQAVPAVDPSSSSPTVGSQTMEGVIRDSISLESG